MAEMDYKYGCNNCGRYAEVRMKTGFGDIGKFDDNDIPQKLEKLCICKSKGGN